MLVFSPPPYCQVYGARALYMMRIKLHGNAGGPLRPAGEEEECRARRDLVLDS